jgi:hypothetical protein
MKGMKIESRLSHLVQCSSCVQRVEPDDDASYQRRRDLGRTACLEKFLKTSVAKTGDHTPQQ